MPASQNVRSCVWIRSRISLSTALSQPGLPGARFLQTNQTDEARDAVVMAFVLAPRSVWIGQEPSTTKARPN